MATTETCWWCENEIAQDDDDAVTQDGELMHSVCRDAHLRSRELERQDDIDTDHQA
jgi:hypothetical protein